jgi:hypothetical protein
MDEDESTYLIFQGALLMWALSFLPWIEVLGTSMGMSVRWGWQIGGGIWIVTALLRFERADAVAK